MRSARLVAPLVCFSVRSCNRTFRSPVLIRSFCLRVFAFPFGSVRHSLSRVIHPGLIQFLGRGYKFRALVPAAFCVLSVVFPAFAVKCFFWDSGAPPIPQCAHWGLPPKGEARRRAMLGATGSIATREKHSDARETRDEPSLSVTNQACLRRSKLCLLGEPHAGRRRAMLGATGGVRRSKLCLLGVEPSRTDVPSLP